MYKRRFTFVVLSILILANLGSTTQAETEWDLFTQDSPLEPPGTIRGYVFFDVNQNGIFEWPQEQGLPLVDVTVSLGGYQHTYCTGGGDMWGEVPGPGSYGPTPMPSGFWTVIVHVPRGYRATTPVEQVVFVPAGQAITDINFGLYGSGPLVSTVCDASVGQVQSGDIYVEMGGLTAEGVAALYRQIKGNATDVAMGGLAAEEMASVLLPTTGNQPRSSRHHQLALVVALAGFLMLVGTPWCVAQVKRAYKRWW